MDRTLPVQLDRADPRPLAVQLSDEVRRLLVAGTLSSGALLPSTRALAAELSVARATVETAWDQLRAEGWLESRQGAGTTVAQSVATVAAPHSVRVPAPVTPTVSAAHALIGMDAGTPWRPERMPRHLEATWRRAWRAVADATPPRGYDDPRGLPALREALAERIRRLRGLDVGPDDVRITAGTTAGLRHLLVGLPMTPVAVEDPGYRAAVATVLASGRTVRDLPVREGAVPDLVGTSAAYVTPAHQHPLGRVLPASERLALLAEAERHDCLVIEDDYDSEFRYDVAPVPALAALAPERVALLGTASKAVMPSLRLGWMVVPERWRTPVDNFRALTHDTPPWAVQTVFAHLLTEGHVDAVVRSARRAYAERAPRVVAALSPYAELAGPVAGMYSTWLLDEERAVAARAAAEASGFRVNLLSAYCRSSDLTGLVVGFGGPSEAELDNALTVLVKALS